MEGDGLQWKEMAYSGRRWPTVEGDGLQWKEMAYSGRRWPTVEGDGLQWKEMACKAVKPKTRSQISLLNYSGLCTAVY